MAFTLAVRKITRRAGRVYILYSDKNGVEFDSAADVRDWVQTLGNSSEETKDLLRKLLIALWLRQDPTGATPALIEGKQLKLDLAGPVLLELI
jgi:hypothetical protein